MHRRTLLPASLVAPSHQARAYGLCCKAALPAVEHKGCEKEFLALRACFVQAVRLTATNS